jgi:hypothetical protein
LVCIHIPEIIWEETFLSQMCNTELDNCGGGRGREEYARCFNGWTPGKGKNIILCNGTYIG